MTSLIIHDIYHPSYITLVYKYGYYLPLPWLNGVLYQYTNIHFHQKSAFFKYWPTLTSFLGVKESRYRKSDLSRCWRSAQELFKYRIRFAIALANSEISLGKETPLLGYFWRFLASFSYNWPTPNGPNFLKLTKKVWRNTVYLRLEDLAHITPLRCSIYPKTSKKWPFLTFFSDRCPVFGQYRPDGRSEPNFYFFKTIRT